VRRKAGPASDPAEPLCRSVAVIAAVVMVVMMVVTMGRYDADARRRMVMMVVMNQTLAVSSRQFVETYVDEVNYCVPKAAWHERGRPKSRSLARLPPADRR
jgi:hypothetical protein